MSPTGATKPEEVVHKTVVVRALVTSSKSNTVKFLDNQELMGKNEFRNAEFGKYEDGTVVECHFKVAGNRRNLLFVTKSKTGISDPVEAPPEDTGPKLIDELEEWTEGHYFTADLRLGFGAIKRILDNGEIVNALMRGASGYGKTSAYEAFAKKMQMNYMYVDCSTILDPEQWFGYQEARDGDTVFLPTDFQKACATGNFVIVMDEANRIEPWIANPLFPILDHRRRIQVHGVDIAVAPRVLFGMTINEGPQYAGTHQLDKALINRVDIFMHAKPLPRKVEVELVVGRSGLDYGNCDHIVGVASSLRAIVEKDALDVDVSTRTTLKVSRLVKIGMSMRQAFDTVVTNSAQPEDLKPIIDLLNSAGI